MKQRTGILSVTSHLVEAFQLCCLCLWVCSRLVWWWNSVDCLVRNPDVSSARSSTTVLPLSVWVNSSACHVVLWLSVTSRQQQTSLCCMSQVVTFSGDSFALHRLPVFVSVWALVSLSKTAFEFTDFKCSVQVLKVCSYALVAMFDLLTYSITGTSLLALYVQIFHSWFLLCPACSVSWLNQHFVL